MAQHTNSRMQSPFSDSYYCVIEKNGLAFVTIAKNGLIHLKNIAIYNKTGYYPEGLEAHNLIGYKENEHYLYKKTDRVAMEQKFGKLVRFAVWRDPVQRLISCYKLFILEKEPRPYFSYCGLYQDTSFDRFMEFVRFELGKSNPVYQDEHIRKQSDYYKPEDVDYIIPIHKLNQFLTDHNVPIVQEKANKTSVDFRLTDERYIDEIKKLYADDYNIIPNY
jgi:hypothetical protein